MSGSLDALAKHPQGHMLHEGMHGNHQVWLVAVKGFADFARHEERSDG